MSDSDINKLPAQSIVTWPVMVAIAIYAVPLIVFIVWMLPIIISHLYSAIVLHQMPIGWEFLLVGGWYPVVSITFMVLLRKNRGRRVAVWIPAIALMISVITNVAFEYLRIENAGSDLLDMLGAMGLLCLAYGILVCPVMVLLNLPLAKKAFSGESTHEG